MKKTQTHVAYGVIMALIMVVISVIAIVTKTAITHPYLVGILPVIIFLIGLIMNAQAFSKANGANITFGEAFGSCFKATMIVAVIIAVWSVLSVYIFPNLEAEAMENARAQLQAKGFSDDMIEKSMGYAKTFSSPAIKLIGGLIFEAILGAIFSAIAAAVAKKNPQQPQMMA